MVTRVLAILLLFVAVPAHADDDDEPQEHKMRFVERGDVLTISSTALTKLFDTKAYDALDDGPASTVLIQIWIYPEGSTKPVAFVAIERKASYEPWDEIFYISLEEPNGRRKLKEKRKAEALKRLTTIEDLPVAYLKALPYDQVFLLAMRVDLNPVSKETLAEVKRWLSQGTGGGLDRGGEFFGSFVRAFVNPKIADADRVLRIRSQAFVRRRQ
jgi:hypothetical protein